MVGGFSPALPPTVVGPSGRSASLKLLDNVLLVNAWRCCCRGEELSLAESLRLRLYVIVLIDPPTAEAFLAEFMVSLDTTGAFRAAEVEMELGDTTGEFCADFTTMEVTFDTQGIFRTEVRAERGETRGEFVAESTLFDELSLKRMRGDFWDVDVAMESQEYLEDEGECLTTRGEFCDPDVTVELSNEFMAE